MNRYSVKCPDFILGVPLEVFLKKLSIVGHSLEVFIRLWILSIISPLHAWSYIALGTWAKASLSHSLRCECSQQKCIAERLMEWLQTIQKSFCRNPKNLHPSKFISIIHYLTSVINRSVTHQIFSILQHPTSIIGQSPIKHFTTSYQYN